MELYLEERLQTIFYIGRETLEFQITPRGDGKPIAQIILTRREEADETEEELVSLAKVLKGAFTWSTMNKARILRKARWPVGRRS